MLFMNEMEIDFAAERFAAHKTLGPATKTLRNLRDAANENSDGWAYWPKPCRAAKKLQELITSAMHPRESTEPTAKEVRAAYAPIKAFRTKSGIQFAIVEP